MTQLAIGPQWDLAGMAYTILSPCARQILKYWIRCPEFLDESMHPVMLRTAASTTDENKAFQYLVHQANPALAAAVILNELQRKKIVEVLDNGQILLRRSAYVVSHPQFENEPYERSTLNLDTEFPCRRYDDAM
jgi:hypothetical protein